MNLESDRVTKTDVKWLWEKSKINPVWNRWRNWSNEPFRWNGTPHLLFVDDEKLILSSLKRTFADQGYQLSTAENGEEALTVLGKIIINAAIIDLKMPQMDGLTLLNRIKTLDPRVQMVMLTAHGSIKDAVKGAWERHQTFHGTMPEQWHQKSWFAAAYRFVRF